MEKRRSCTGENVGECCPGSAQWSINDDLNEIADEPVKMKVSRRRRKLDELQIDKLRGRSLDQLFEAILTLQNLEECYRFFDDLCTINEIQSLAQRLEVARLLQSGHKYHEIEKKTGASTATISRVKRCLNYGNDAYKMVIDRLEAKKWRKKRGKS